MKMYLISLGCGLLVGVIYSLLQVRSPAPPVVALLGLLGMLLGEQALPLLRWATAEAKTAAASDDRSPRACLEHLFGEMPSVHARKAPAAAAPAAAAPAADCAPAEDDRG